MPRLTIKRAATIAAYLMLGGCAGFSRGCSSFNAGAFGSNWIAVQYRADGTPINCWKLTDTSIANEEKSDGIYWLDTKTGHLVHIGGWYNRIQVSNNRFDEAATLLGVDVNRCGNGIYK